MKRWLLLIPLVLLLVLATPVPVSAQTGSIELMGLEWNHTPTVYIKASRAFQGYVDDAHAAAYDWVLALNDSTHSGFAFASATSAKKADIVIEIRGGASAGVLGLTIPLDKNHDGYFDKVKITVKIGSYPTRVDFQNVVRHEMGHALGLGHETTSTSDLMDPVYQGGQGPIAISALDKEALWYIYLTDGFGGNNLSPADIPSDYPPQT